MPSNEVRSARGMLSVHCLGLISSIAGGGIHQAVPIRNIVAKFLSQLNFVMMCVKQPVL